MKREDERIRQNLIERFHCMANEKMALSNIRLINSVKYTFSKLYRALNDAQPSRPFTQPTLPNQKISPICADIESINNWLLEISHFILDNHSKAIRDSLAGSKVPIEVLCKSIKEKQSVDSSYEVIPQYVFKEF